MPPSDSTAIIVARFLKSNNYTESYDAFITEAGLPLEAGTTSKGDLTLETLLEEKQAFDLSSRFEKMGVDEGGEKGWTAPAPSIAQVIRTLPSSANILSVSAENSTLIVTTADRYLHLLDADSEFAAKSLIGLQNSPILSCQVMKGEYLFTGSMTGQLVLSNFNGDVLECRRNHTKYIVKIATYEDELVATAGWDSKVIIYKPSLSHAESNLRTPLGIIDLPSKPEAMIFIRHPESQHPVLVISRTDSSFLYYYTIGSEESPPRLLGRQNLAPHSNAWVAFTPSAFAICPTDSSLLAVALSTVPHMKLAIVRLLIPPFNGEHSSLPLPLDPVPVLRTSLLDDRPEGQTQASQAQAALLTAEREHAAILIHCTTLAPQTAYSTPSVAWRPDGMGVWVNGEDGVVRGIEALSGKIVATLKGHDAESKVRCLWAGYINEKEVLVSGGFDQKLIVWEVGN